MTCSQAIGMAALGAAVLGFFFGALSHRQFVRMAIRAAKIDDRPGALTITAGGPIQENVWSMAAALRMINGGPIR